MPQDEGHAKMWRDLPKACINSWIVLLYLRQLTKGSTSWPHVIASWCQNQGDPFTKPWGGIWGLRTVHCGLSNVLVGIPFPFWYQGYFSQMTGSQPLPPGDTQRHITGSFFLPAALYEELSSPSHPIDHPSESPWNHPGCARGRKRCSPKGQELAMTLDAGSAWAWPFPLTNLRDTVAMALESILLLQPIPSLLGGTLILCSGCFPQEAEDIIYQHNSLESIVPTTEPVKQRQGRVIIISSRWQLAANPGGIRFLSLTLLDS